MAHLVYHFRTNKAKRDEMLELRRQGWSYTALAEKYECPKLVIRSFARKYGLGQATISVQFTRTDYLQTHTAPKILESTEEKISQGKTYAEYLKEEEERKKRRLNEQ